MADTNFTLLTNEQKTAWSKDVWKTARQASFIMSSLAGRGMNSPIQRITELTASEKGTRAVLTCVPDLEGDGVVGDYEIEGNEEAAKAYDLPIEVDQLRNANRIAGRMADQKSVVRFRETSRDLLGFWLADRVDQLASLIASGIDPRVHTNGKIRTGFSYDAVAGAWVRDTVAVPIGKALVDLEFISSDPAADKYGDKMTPPSAKRWFRWNAGGGLEAVDPTTTPAYTSPNVTASDTPSYSMLVEAKAYAKDRRLKPLRGSNGRELFHVLMHPKAIAKLKLDQEFLANVRSMATATGRSSSLATGAIETVDGLVIHEFTHVFNTLGATSDSANAGNPGVKWGDGTIDGSTVLFLGAQGLGYADIGIPEWDERDHFDYGAKPGIAIAKICGFLKPQFYSPMDGSSEDFGVMRVDVAI